MCVFKKLKKKCGVNDPTPIDIYVIETSKVTTLPAPTTTLTGTVVYNTITTAPTLTAGLASGDKWQVLQLRRSSVKFTDDVTGEVDTNQRRDQKLVGFYPEADPEAFYNLSLAIGSELLIGWKNGNNAQQLWGTLEQVVVCTKANFDSSKGGWDLEFIREARANEVVPFYTGIFDVS